MPLYDYQCTACQHRGEELVNRDDTSLLTCPACGKQSYQRQLSAPNFQLKGTGWYVTDFKDKKSAADTNNTATSSDTKGSD